VDSERVFALCVGAVFGLLPYAVKDMPPFIAWIGILGAVAICAMTFTPINPRLIWPIAVMTTSGLFFVAAMSWLYQRLNEAPQMPSTSDSIKTNTSVSMGASPAAASMPNIYMECVAANLPDVWPNGPLYTLDLNPIPAPFGGGLAERGINSSPVKWEFQGMTYRCQLINYSDAPIFNVELFLHLIFREAIINNKLNQYDSGVVTVDREWSIRIGKLDPGKDNPYTFFVMNMSTQFVEATLPNTITIHNRKELIIDLHRGPTPIMHFGPRLLAPSPTKAYICGSFCGMCRQRHA